MLKENLTNKILLISIIPVYLFVILNLLIYIITGNTIGEFYSYTMLGVSIIVYLIFFTSIIVKKKSKKSFFLLVFTIFIVAIFAMYNIQQDYVKETFTYFFIWAIPGALSGILLSSYNKDAITKFLYYFFWASSSILLLVSVYLGYELTSEDLVPITTYQEISYLSAFSFGLGLYFLSEKGKFLNRIFHISLLINNLIVCFLSGGRGGAILLIIYILVYLIKNLYTLKFLNSFIFLTVIFIVIRITSQNIISERTFSYIDDGFINLGATSGRDTLYNLALNYIVERPIFGYGLFNYYDFFNGFPHNIILEILLIGGILGFLIFLVAIIYFIYITIIKIKENSVDSIILFVLLLPAVKLLFSGNFLNLPELWFAIFYILSVNYSSYHKSK